MNLLVVGKLSDKEIQILENDYLKRLNPYELKIHELKSHSENLKKESDEIILRLKALYKNTDPFIVLLTENGILYDSPQFSKWLHSKLHTLGDKLVFIIGGAAGFGEEIKAMANLKLSLSPLTFPHKLARLLLIEQIYRAQTIQAGHPYHK